MSDAYRFPIGSPAYRLADELGYTVDEIERIIAITDDTRRRVHDDDDAWVI